MTFMRKAISWVLDRSEEDMKCRDLRNYFCRCILTLQLPVPKQRRRNAKNSFNVDKTCYMSHISSSGLLIIFADNRHCYFTFIPHRGRGVVGHLCTTSKMIPLPNKERWLNLQLTLSLLVHIHRVMSILYVSSASQPTGPAFLNYLINNLYFLGTWNDDINRNLYYAYLDLKQNIFFGSKRYMIRFLLHW